MKRSTHLMLSVLCVGALSASPAFADQGKGKDKGGNQGRAHDVQKNKDKDKDKDKSKDDKDRRGDYGRNDRDRERTDDRNRDNTRSDGAMRFRGLDTNNDGRISRSEWRGNDTSFANHDWNRDGVLSGDEVREGATRPSTRRR